MSKKRRMVALGAVLVVSATVGTAGAGVPDGAAGPWADNVIEFTQGKQADGNPVRIARSDPEAALGVAEGTLAPETNWFSIGFGGHIVLHFENDICNGAGESDLDISFVEATIEEPNPYPNEVIRVFVSPDNVTYTEVGTLNKDGALALPASVTVAQHYVKIVDITNKDDYVGPSAPQQRPDADGYDLDGVKALNTGPCSEKVGVGRMTGGGSLFLANGTRVTHGFTLRCDDPAAGGNDIQINWDKGNKFHLEGVPALDCYDDPTISEGNPVAGFDTIVGSGTGRYNGVSGYKIEFRLTDAGEPGVDDFGYIVITAPDNTQVLNVQGLITKGNQQAHHSG